MGGWVCWWVGGCVGGNMERTTYTANSCGEMCDTLQAIFGNWIVCKHLMDPLSHIFTVRSSPQDRMTCDSNPARFITSTSYTKCV
jgi:hypothetical protein